MTRPSRYFSRMVLFVMLVGAVATLVFPALEQAFMANPPLNGLILFALVVGILYMFRQVLILSREVRWLEYYQQDSPRHSKRAPRATLLAPMARMLGERRGPLMLSALSMRSLLDGLAARLDESRELSRYLIGLLIFLGLLGTFWGLLNTIRSVGGVIGSMQVTGGDAAVMFGTLKKGLEAPLAGMGSAFSASLFGLAGSLVLGFLELQSTQAQHRFFQDVEDWLSGATRLSSGAAGALESGEQSVPAYLEALLEQTAENLEALQHTVASGEDSRRRVNDNMMALTERLAELADQMRAQQTLLGRLADMADQGSGTDEATRQHMRNMDIYLARLLEEVSSGRIQAVQEIRSEIKLVARTIAALADDPDGR
jgi:hypothetical protein